MEKITVKKKGNCGIYALAFFIPVAVMLLHMVISGSAPFGSGSVLAGADGQQTYAVTMEFYHKVRSGDSLLFSWNQGLGSNFYGTMLYYLMSPLNWLILLFPEGAVDVGLLVVIFIRLGLVGVAGTFYFMHADVFRENALREPLSLMFGLVYALSPAVVGYYFMPGWLDTFWLFPFAVYGLSCILDKDGWKCYYVSLTLLMITNFYLAVFAGLFLLFWFFCHVDYRVFSKKMGLLAKTTFGALLSAFFVLLPAINVIMDKGFSALSEKYGFASLASLFCGVITAFFVLYYFLFVKYEGKTKLRLALLLVFLLLSICLFGWKILPQGFLFMDAYGSRYAFAVVFCICCIGAKGMQGFLSAREAKRSPKLLVFLLLAFSVLELSVGTLYRLGTGSASEQKTELNENEYALAQAVGADKTAGRAAVFGMPNAGLLYDFPAAGMTSPLVSENTVEMYKDLGLSIQTDYRGYSYEHGTPFTDMLFNIVNADDNALGYGFVIPKPDMVFRWENPFYNQNILANRFVGVEGIFSEIELPVDRKNMQDGWLTVSYVCPKDMDLYIFARDYHTMYLNVKVKGKSILDEVTRACQKTVHVGQMEEGQKVEITVRDYENRTDTNTVELYAAELLPEEFAKVKEALSSNAFRSTAVSGTRMTGEVEAKENAYLYLSVPNDGGFSVWIDGAQEFPEYLYDCLMLIPVSAGRHEVVLKYCPPGFREGIFVSVVGILLVLLYWFFPDKMTTKKKEEDIGKDGE